MKSRFAILMESVIFLLCTAYAVHSQNVFNYIYEIPIYPTIRNVIPVDSGYIIAGGHSNPNVSVLIGYVDFQGNLVSYKSYHSPIDWYHGLEGSLIKTSDGGFALAGSTDNTGLLFKFDHNLDTIWKKEYILQGGASLFYGCAETESGYALAGSFENSTGDSLYMILLKTDINGNYLWHKLYSMQSVSAAFGIIKTSDGGFLLSGDTFTYLTTEEWYLVKTDSLGNLQWQRHYGNPNIDDGYVACVIETHDSCFIVTGAYGTTPISMFDSYRRGRMIKLDQNGNIIWDRLYLDEFYYPWISEIIENEDHTFVSLGRDKFNENILMKFTSTGDVIWKRKFSMFGATTIDDALEHLAKTEDGGYILVGYGLGEEDDQDQQAWIIKTDSMGCDGYQSCNDTAVYIDVSPYYISVQAGNHLAIKTYIYNGNAPFTVTYSTGEVHYPVYLTCGFACDSIEVIPDHDTVIYVTVSYGNSPGVTDSALIFVHNGISENMQSAIFEITPNPATNNIEISYTFATNPPKEINIYTTQSVCVKSVPIKNQLGKVSVNLNLPVGVYYVKAGNCSKKLIIL